MDVISPSFLSNLEGTSKKDCLNQNSLDDNSWARKPLNFDRSFPVNDPNIILHLDSWVSGSELL